MAVAYIDYSSMEFMIGAALSDKHDGPVNNMADMYNSGDPYRAFANRVGAIPDDITTEMIKKPQKHVTHNLTLEQLEYHAEVRAKYKVMMLATQYAMSAETLAGRLGISSLEAHEMLNLHRDLLSQYWHWSDDWVQHALQSGVMQTAHGWTCRTGITEFNDRSMRNWPVQAAGADILRIACIMAVRHGIGLIAPVHDAVMIEAPIDRIEADVALMREIMRRASRIVLNVDATGTYEIRTDYTIVRYPDRYSDGGKRGAGIWKDGMKLLEAIKKQREVAY
jgi:DNA polymerase-1